MTKFIIRRLNEKDFKDYYRLLNHFRLTIFTPSDFIKTLESIKRQNSEIWVIDLNGSLIGTGTILYEHKFIHNISKIGHIEDICIDTNYRGKGFGQLLINYLIEEAKTNMCYKVTLYCEENLEKFYNFSGLNKKGIQMAKYF
jgi:glucosamine-phosphate N-acetyltransferase